MYHQKMCLQWFNNAQCLQSRTQDSQQCLMCWKDFIDCWCVCMAFQKTIDWCSETEVPVQKHTYNASSWCLKGQFTQNDVIIYSASSISRPVWMCLFCWTQRKIFWRMWGTEQFWIIVFSSTVEVNGAQNSLITNFLQNIFLCVQQNKHIHTGLEILGWVNDDEFHFWVNYPFNIVLCY